MKKLFFVTPIGDYESQERKISDFVMHSFLDPVASELGYEVLRSDLLNTVEKIDDSVIQQLKESELVVIDVTGTNPNVMFEFGIRYALSKPFVVISQDVNSIPFDVRNIRTLEYTITAPDINEFNKKLKKMIEVVVLDSPNNTITDSPEDLGEKFGMELAMRAIQTGDLSQLDNFKRIAEMFDINTEDDK